MQNVCLNFSFFFFLGGTVTRKHWLCEHDCMIMGFTGFYKKIGVINQKKATSARVYFFLEFIKDYLWLIGRGTRLDWMSVFI